MDRNPPLPSRERRGGAYIIDIDSSSSSFIFSRLQYNIVRMETFPPSRRPVFISSWFSAQHFIQPLPNPLDMTLFVDELDWKSFFIFLKRFIKISQPKWHFQPSTLTHTKVLRVCPGIKSVKKFLFFFQKIPGQEYIRDSMQIHNTAGECIIICI
jgi:hypothetical protein